MALDFIDSCAHYAAADVGTKWTSTIGGASIVTGRFSGSSALQMGSGQYVERTLTTPHTTVTVGAAWRVTATNSNLNVVFWMLDGATIQTDLRFDNTMRLYITRNGTQLASTAAGYITLNTWYYLEMKSFTDPTSGTSELRVNGVSVLTFSGNTRTTATSQITGVRFHHNNTFTQTCNYGDIYICTGAGSRNNSFLGEQRVVNVLPTAAGTTTDWTPSAGANYAAVDDATANGDTDYVSSDTANQIDLYNYPDVTGAGVNGVQVVPWARKDDAGTRTLATQVRTASTNYTGANVDVPSGYKALTQVWETNPNTTNTWTLAEVNAAEYGIKLIA